MRDAVDVVIIGAGVAGLSAAHAAHADGLSFVILEAKNRVGGRAFTESASLGAAMDHGAHYLHAASLNPFRDYADRHGLAYRRGGYDRRIQNGEWFLPQRAELFDVEARDALTRVATESDDGNGLSVADLLPRSMTEARLFRGFYEEFLGASAAEVAAGEHKRYIDTFEDWPVSDGLGALIAHYGQNVPVVTGCPVTEIDYRARSIAVHTPRGTIAARHVVLTVSAGVLAREAIRITPNLPNAKLHALDGVAMGYAGKVAFSLKAGGFADFENSHAMVLDRHNRFVNLVVRPFGKPLLIAIFGGPDWEMIERAGADAMIEAVIEIIRDSQGTAAVAALDRVMATHWVSDPHILGGHSYMRPEYGDARVQLASPVDNRLFFAGEACSTSAWATVHGARETGMAAIATIGGKGKGI